MFIKICIKLYSLIDITRPNMPIFFIKIQSSCTEKLALISVCIKAALVPVFLTVDITFIDLPMQTHQLSGFHPICLCFRWHAKAGAWDASVESGWSLCWSSDPGNRRTCPGYGWRSSPSALPGWPPRKVSVCVTSPNIYVFMCVCVCLFLACFHLCGKVIKM